MVVDTKNLGMVDDSDKVVDTRVEEETTASIIGRSRVLCTFQVISIEPLHQTNSGSGKIFATKYRVIRPRTRVAHSEEKETVVAGQMLHHRTWTAPRSTTVSRAAAIRCEVKHLSETEPSGQVTEVPGVKVRP